MAEIGQPTAPVLGVILEDRHLPLHRAERHITALRLQ